MCYGGDGNGRVKVCGPGFVQSERERFWIDLFRSY